MSRVRLYLDTDSMGRALVAALRDHGADVVTSFEAGMSRATDEEQLEYARQNARVLVSFNASDFLRIHTQLLSAGRSHAGIILMPQQRYSIGERLRRLLTLLAARTAEEMHNRLEFLSDWA